MSQMRRDAIQLAYWNGLLWAVGNGLASTTLVVYLALDLGAKGRAIGWILAAPQLVGTLRWWLSRWVGRGSQRKRFCLASYAVSVALLLLLPVVSAPDVLPTTQSSLAALVVLWCGYHFFEYLGTMALWSWLGEMAPPRVRGRFLGRREAWMIVGRLVSMMAAGGFAYLWRRWQPEAAAWLGYSIPAAAGALMMLLALLPLVKAPALDAVSSRCLSKNTNAAWWQPALDRRFGRLLVFGCWFSFFNGLTQSVQNIYPARILGFSLLAMLGFRTLMRLGQLAIAPEVGRLVDRIGNRPVMMSALAVVACGPAFFLIATPESPWWVVGAFVAWTAYAGLNVGLPGLILKLSPAGSDNAPHLGFYFGVTGLVYAVSTLLGGELFDWAVSRGPWQLGWLGSLDGYGALFLLGWVTRLSAIVWLSRVVEPGAWQWRQWFLRRHAVALDAEV